MSRRLPRVSVLREDDTVGAAIDAFLARPELSSASRRSYSQTLDLCRRALGAKRPLASLGCHELEAAMLQAFGGLAPATWNRHLAALRSFQSFCRRRGWLQEELTTGLERRRESADRTKAIPYPKLESLWRRDDIALREKVLWRLLYETAARAEEALSLNVEDVDVANKRARIVSKAGISSSSTSSRAPLGCCRG